MQPEKMLGGMIPENLLRLNWTENHMPVLIWYTKAQQVDVTYTSNLHVPNGKINVPAMLWKYDSEDEVLSVWALDSDERPHKKTVLYHAPFHNVYVDAKVCIGTGSKYLKKKMNSYSDFMKAAELVFWKTTFSEIHNEGAASRNLNTLHHELVTTQMEFPIHVLIPTKINLWK